MNIHLNHTQILASNSSFNAHGQYQKELIEPAMVARYNEDGGDEAKLNVTSGNGHWFLH